MIHTIGLALSPSDRMQLATEGASDQPNSRAAKDGLRDGFFKRRAWSPHARLRTNAGRFHVHVRAAGCQAKLWLDPQIRVAASYGFDAGTLRELVEAAQSHRELIERAWHDYFG